MIGRVVTWVIFAAIVGLLVGINYVLDRIIPRVEKAVSAPVKERTALVVIWAVSALILGSSD